MSSSSRAPRDRGDDDDASAANNFKHPLKTMIQQPPRSRRRSEREICEPQRFVARPSKRGLSVADGDAIILASKMQNDDRCNERYDVAPAVPLPPKIEISVDSHTYNTTESTSIHATKQSLPSDCLHQEDNGIISLMDDDDDDDEVELLSTPPINIKQSNPLLPPSSIANTRKRRSCKSVTGTDASEKVVGRDVMTNNSFSAATSAKNNNSRKSNSTTKCTSTSLIYDNMLDFQVSSKSPDGRFCRATSCTKFMQAGRNGFCCVHYNRYLISIGQCSWWECTNCGGRNVDVMKRCCECHKWRYGKILKVQSPRESSPKVVTKKADISIRKMVVGKSRGRRDGLRDTTADATEDTATSAKMANAKKMLAKGSVKGQDLCSTASTTTSTGEACSGIRSLRTYVPPDHVAKISNQRRTNIHGRAYCKVITCDKLDQSKMDGFCKRHFNIFALNSTNGLNAGKRGNTSISPKKRCRQSNKLRLDSFSEEGSDDIIVGSTSFRYNYDNYVGDWLVGTDHPPGGRKIKNEKVEELHSHTSPTVESIDDDDDDEFSFSDLRHHESELSSTAQQREIRLDLQTANDASPQSSAHWKCLRCENLNTPQSRCCSICRCHYDEYKRSTSTYSEVSLLERTRYELLNGRDFWICTHCVIAIPSLTMPCGKCKRMISFVPLDMQEFEEFVRKQREKAKHNNNVHWQQQHHVEEL